MRVIYGIMIHETQAKNWFYCKCKKCIDEAMKRVCLNFYWWMVIMGNKLWVFSGSLVIGKAPWSCFYNHTEFSLQLNVFSKPSLNGAPNPTIWPFSNTPKLLMSQRTIKKQFFPENLQKKGKKFKLFSCIPFFIALLFMLKANLKTAQH